MRRFSGIKYSISLILICVCLSCLFTVTYAPFIVIANYNDKSEKTSCGGDSTNQFFIPYRLISIFVNYFVHTFLNFLFALISVIKMGIISHKASGHSLQVKKYTWNQNRKWLVNLNEYQSTIIILLVVLLDLILFVPLTIIVIVLLLERNNENQLNLSITASFFKQNLCIALSLNFFVYLIKIETFRSSIKNMFFFSRQRHENNYVTSTSTHSDITDRSLVTHL